MVDNMEVQRLLSETLFLVFDLGQTETGFVAALGERVLFAKTIRCKDVDEMIVAVARAIRFQGEQHTPSNGPKGVVALEGSHLDRNPRTYCELCQLIGAAKAPAFVIRSMDVYVLTTTEIDSALSIFGDRKRGIRIAADRSGFTGKTQHEYDAWAIYQAALGMRQMDIIMALQEAGDE